MAQLKSTSVTGNLSVTGNTVASKFIKNNGTSDQLLLANGTVTSLSTITNNISNNTTTILTEKGRIDAILNATTIKTFKDVEDTIAGLTTENIGGIDEYATDEELLDTKEAILGEKDYNGTIKGAYEAIEEVETDVKGRVSNNGDTMTGQLFIDTTSDSTLTKPALKILHTGPTNNSSYADLMQVMGDKNNSYGFAFRTNSDGTAIIQSKRFQLVSGSTALENFPLSLNPDGGDVFVKGEKVATEDWVEEGDITMSGPLSATAIIPTDLKEFDGSEYNGIIVGKSNSALQYRTKENFIQDLHLSQVYNYKGTVENVNALKLIKSARVGDVYFISDPSDSSNWACKKKFTLNTGTGDKYKEYWGDIGSTIDLSGYVTRDTTQEISGQKIFTSGNGLIITTSAYFTSPASASAITIKDKSIDCNDYLSINAANNNYVYITNDAESGGLVVEKTVVAEIFQGIEKDSGSITMTKAQPVTIAGNTTLNGNLTVVTGKSTTLNGPLTVNSTTTFNNTVSIAHTNNESAIIIQNNTIKAQDKNSSETDLYLGSNRTKVHIGENTVGSINQPIYLNGGVPNRCNLYSGGTQVTLNNSNLGSSTASFYAPTRVGNSGEILQSNGSGEPSWLSILPVGHGGTGTNSLETGQALIGNGTNAVSFRAITNMEAKAAVPANDNLITANTLHFHEGSDNITTVGTLTTGTWNATTIAVDKGGTGKTTWTANRLIYASGTTTIAFNTSSHYINSSRVAINSTTQPSNNFYVNGDSAFGGTVLVTNGNSTTLNGPLDVNSTTTLDGTLTVNAATTLDGTLTVSEATTLNAALTVNAVATINDDLTVNGYIITSDSYGLGDESMTIIPGHNNEINFGGTNTSSSIYFCWIVPETGEARTGRKIQDYYFTGSSGTASLHAGKYYATSDIRLKENFRPFEHGSILDLPLYKFDFINGKKDVIGCIAQDLKKICPEIVGETEEGYLSIEESKIVYLLIDEVKKLKEEIQQLKGE